MLCLSEVNHHGGSFEMHSMYSVRITYCNTVSLSTPLVSARYPMSIWAIEYPSPTDLPVNPGNLATDAVPPILHVHTLPDLLPIPPKARPRRLQTLRYRISRYTSLAGGGRSRNTTSSSSLIGGGGGRP